MRKFIIAAGVLACCVAGAAYAGWIPLGRGAKKSPVETPVAMTKASEAVAVTVAAAVPRSVERRVRTVGTLHGFEEIEIAPLVDGHVRAILHEVGDLVRPGEPLLEIDDADFRLTVQEMSRALELELSKLGLTAPPPASFDVTMIPAVMRAQLVERNAADTFERYKRLVDNNAMSRDDFSKTELNLDVARLDTKQRVMEAEQTLAAIRHRQAILATAEKRLRDTNVVTPSLIIARAGSPAINLVSTASALTAAGPAYTVAERLVSAGEIVRAAPPTPLFRLVVEDPLKFQSAVPERYSAQIRVGQPVDLAVEALPGRKVVGQVVRVSPTVDTASRTFQVEISVPNAERQLKPGTFATASILIGSDAQAVTVPEESIVRFAGVTKLFALTGERVTAVPVETGTRLEIRDAGGAPRRWVEILGNVPSGTQVVTTGHAQLADGSSVRVRTAANEPSASAAVAPDAAQEARRLEIPASRKESR